MTTTTPTAEEDLALSASAWLERTYDAKARLIATFQSGRRFLTPDELAFLATPPAVWTPYHDAPAARRTEVAA